MIRDYNKYLTKKTILVLAGMLLICGGMIVFLKFIGIDELKATVDRGGVWSPLIYITLKIVTYVVAPLSAAPILIASGTIFGVTWGTIYSLIGDTIGACLNFWIARSFGRTIIIKIIGDKGMAKVDDVVHKIGEWQSLLFLRFFLFPIYDFVSYSVGLTLVRFRLFLLITFFGGIIPTIINVSLGASLSKYPLFIALVYLILLGFFIIAVLFRKYAVKPKDKQTGTANY